MLAQIEITTRCNYQCFYCAGRDMKQAHMPWERFNSIIERLPEQAVRVSLQGEGEPMMHPRFWDMVAAIQQRKLIPYTITNGSIINSQRIANAFPLIGISLDTLDAAMADRIGRYKLPRVLRNIDRLLTQMAPDRIIIHTVNMGQPIDDIKSYLQQRGLTKHIIQPLQSKSDYSKRYDHLSSKNLGSCTFRCRYLETPIMRYYTLNGTELPCCFIKDSSTFGSIAQLKAELAKGVVPTSCMGCRMIFPHAQVSIPTAVIVGEQHDVAISEAIPS